MAVPALVRLTAMGAEAVPWVVVGKVDLSAFSSMLKTKWKTGSVAGAAETKKAPEAGQVRSFRVAQLDSEARRIGLELTQ